MKKPMLLYSVGRSATVRLLPGDPNAGAQKNAVGNERAGRHGSLGRHAGRRWTAGPI